MGALTLEAAWLVQNADLVPTGKVRVIWTLIPTLFKIQYVPFANRENSAIMNVTTGVSIAPREPTAPLQGRLLAYLVTQALMLPTSIRGHATYARKIPTNRVPAQAAVFPVMRVILAHTE